MTKLELNAIATRAIVDEQFESAILNGHRHESLEEFSLPADIFSEVMAINANNLRQFLVQLNEIVKQPSI